MRQIFSLLKQGGKTELGNSAHSWAVRGDTELSKRAFGRLGQEMQLLHKEHVAQFDCFSATQLERCYWTT